MAVHEWKPDPDGVRVTGRLVDTSEGFAPVGDDIVNNLQAISQFVGGAGPKLREAADEIERLRAQVEHAHAILASEGAAWLVVGSNHEWAWRQSLTSAIQSYWDKYGNYFKKADRG